MNAVCQNNLVDLKIVKVESDSHTFYQVWKDGIICKQSESCDECAAYTDSLINEMVDSKLQDLESEVYWTGQAYLHCTEAYSSTCANDYTQAQINLNQFKSKMLCKTK